MIIQLSGAIFACKVGDGVTNRYTILTNERRTFHAVDGTPCIYEGSQVESLKVWLRSDFGEGLAKELGIPDDQRISRLRIALGVGYEDGGNRRKVEHEDAPDLTGRLKVIGEAPKQIIILSAGLDTWQIVAGTQIVLQPTVKNHLKRWLQSVTVDDAAEKLQVGKRQITDIKRLLDILRK